MGISFSKGPFSDAILSFREWNSAPCFLKPFISLLTESIRLNFETRNAGLKGEQNSKPDMKSWLTHSVDGRSRIQIFTGWVGSQFTHAFYIPSGAVLFFDGFLFTITSGRRPFSQCLKHHNVKSSLGSWWSTPPNKIALVISQLPLILFRNPRLVYALNDQGPFFHCSNGN